MGPLLVLVSPCFRENVVVTCKIGSFCVVQIIYFTKNVIVFFFENQISKWSSFEKKLFLTYFSHFFMLPGKIYKNSFSTYLTHVHTCILLTFWHFCLTNFEKKYEFIRYGFSLVWFLVLILILITKWWAKFKLECLLLICIYTNAKFTVICKPLTLNCGG